MYNTRNQLAGKPYDSAGNGSPVDGRSYQYDVENRIVSISGGTAETAESFTYDGDGRRVKRVLNGVTTTYVYDAFGQMAQEYGGTPGPAGRSYLFADHLGSTRMRVDGNGVAQGWWDYLPYGEEITGDRGNRSGAAGWAYGGAEPSMMFTGQTRDRLADGNTSGLDYFGARYMSPGQGRWTSPDVINLTSARLINPSNTLNKYEYAGNNPFKYVDPDGRDLVAVYKPTGTPGHFWLVAYNERSGDFAVRNFGPVKTEVETLYRTVPGSDWAKQFATELANPDQLKQYAVLTIQTNPEEAQKVIDQINSNDPVPLGYNVRDRNCTTVCREALSAIMALDSRIWRPQDLWNTLWYGYSNRAISTGRMSVFLQVETAAGKDHGRPRWGLDTFDFLSLIIKLHNKAPEPKACVSVSDSATGTSTKPECK
jgi:RHS repeat-associated protein